MCDQPDVSRRGFLVGCSAAIAGLAGSRFNSVAFADPGSNEEILIIVFLRGGMDGLSLVPPIDGSDRGHYEGARPSLQIPTTGPGAAIPLNAQFGMHPAAASLVPLFQDQKLSIIQAVGMPIVNKSHFDAMAYVELGTPGQQSVNNGWLTRHLQSASNIPPEANLPSIAVGDLQPQSLLGSFDTLNLDDPTSFNLENAPWRYRDGQRLALRNIYEGANSFVHAGGVNSLDSISIVQLNVQGGYTPANGAIYPDGEFGEQLQVLAQMIKLDQGLQVATVDVGGWDTHDAQGNGSEGYLAGLFQELADGLAAFYLDLDGAAGGNYTNRLTVLVQSEFGRELHQNDDSGTEHGYGNLMLALSGNAVGGFHGAWPSLAPGALVDGTDLAVTTDYRQVLSEVLIRRMCNPAVYDIFPGYENYQPLGFVSGNDLPPVGGSGPSEIFSDGFESGNFNGWTSVE